MNADAFEDIRLNGEHLIADVRRLIAEGNARRLIIRSAKGKTLFDTPLTLGTLGIGGLFMLHPVISTVSAFVMLSNDVQIIIKREVSSGDESEPPKSSFDDTWEVEADFTAEQENPSADS
ncbi:protein of unknown function (DUF4342) [Cyclonatronum proteinivorum]|uniref:DUF4342 domain-containing protein n=1 Tax=Cyclonatronum proteinivorum TaxID=1457365 RepID=A0A345UFX4_9BACT|nr:DUF4342 domain-containing protein [Cyclonatronum proteinivorum]AXI99375.1 protein of unknown function (DUF4342) [Cyclonatronum proteinivorum]